MSDKLTSLAIDNSVLGNVIVDDTGADYLPPTPFSDSEHMKKLWNVVARLEQRVKELESFNLSSQLDAIMEAKVDDENDF